MLYFEYMILEHSFLSDENWNQIIKTVAYYICYKMAIFINKLDTFNCLFYAMNFILYSNTSYKRFFTVLTAKVHVKMYTQNIVVETQK